MVLRKHQVRYGVALFLLIVVLFTGCGKDTAQGDTSVNPQTTPNVSPTEMVAPSATPTEAPITATSTPTSPPTSVPSPEATVVPTVASTEAPTEASVKIPVVITGLDKKAECVSIKNISDKDIDLTSWYIVSVRGEQKYKFPNGYIIKAGAEIKVVSYQATGDLVWTTANMWSNTKSDPAELYNAEGFLQSRWDD